MHVSDDYVKRDEFNRLDSRVSNLDSRVSNLDIRQTRTEVRTEHVEEKINKIESNTTWILRIIVSSIVVALLGVIMI